MILLIYFAVVFIGLLICAFFSGADAAGVRESTYSWWAFCLVFWPMAIIIWALALPFQCAFKFGQWVARDTRS